MDPFTLLTIISTLSTVAGGVAANDAAQKEAAAIRGEGDIELAEGERLAKIKETEGKQFRSDQALAFLASGINLQGSPLGVLEETQTKTKDEVDSIMGRARNLFDLSRSKADITQRKGTNALIGGVLGGANTARLAF